MAPAGFETLAGVRGEVSPYFIARVSGAPVEGVEATRAEAAVDALDALERADAESARLGEALAERLYAAVGRAEGKRARRRMLALKRDAHNGRAIDEATRVAAGALLEAADARALAAYAAAVRARERLLARYEAAYVEARDRARRARWRAVEAPAFRSGLLLASPTLSAKLEAALVAGWEEAADPEPPASGRLGKLERSLLRYWTRTALKATPFATLCSIVEGRFAGGTDGARRARDDDVGPLVRFEGDPSPGRSVVRLNKKLYRTLFAHLTAVAAARRGLEVERNPTLRPGADGYEYLAGFGEREVFQRMKPPPVLDVVAERVGAGRRRRVEEVTGALVADERLETTEAEAEAFVVRLLDLGFLRYRTGIAEQDAEWDRPLAALCRRLEGEEAGVVAELLEALRARLEPYGRGGPAERARILAECRELLRAAWTGLGLGTDPSRIQIYYEDAGAEARCGVSVARDDPLFGELVEFGALALKVAWPRAERAAMREYFERTYEPGARVALLRFYEDFWRGHYGEHLEREREAKAGKARAGYDLQNPYGLLFAQRVREAQGRLARLTRERWAEAPDAEEVRIGPEEMAEALAGVPAPSDGLCRSLSVFAQLVPGTEGGEAGEGGAPARVLLPRADFLAGWGKYLSRFLHVLPDRMRRGVEGRNGRLSAHRVAEIGGDGAFNANLHPRLVAWEIGYPTGEGGRSGAESLEAAELEVERDPADEHGLRLVHAPSGERVVPVDLGFLNPMMRPPLFQLLSRLGPPVRFGWPMPEGLPAAGADRGAGAARVGEGTPDVGLTPKGEGRPADAAARSDGSGAPAGPDAPSGATAEAPAGAEHAPAPPPPPPPPPPVVHRPRIVFGERLILARRAWLIPKGAFPAPEAGEAATAYFRRVRRWREANGLPEEGYVRVRNRMGPRRRNAAVAEKPADGSAEGDAGAGPEAPADQPVESDADAGTTSCVAEEAEAADGPGASVEDAVAESWAEEPDAERGEEPMDAAAEAERTADESAEGERVAPDGRRAAARTAPSYDFRKPQYVDFRSPPLVELFGRVPGPLADYTVVFEERLPAGEALPRGPAGRHAYELVLQLDYPEAEAGAAATTERPDAAVQRAASWGVPSGAGVVAGTAETAAATAAATASTNGRAEAAARAHGSR